MDSLLNTYIEPTWFSLVNKCTEDNFIFYGTILAHSGSFLLFNMQYILYDLIPYFNKYKIQKNIKNSLNFKKIIFTLFYQVFLDVCFLYFSIPILKYFGFGPRTPLPSLFYFISSLMICVVLDDFFSYFIHRTIHTPFFYKHVHKKHHILTSPDGFSAEYITLYEGLAYGMATFVCTVLFQRHLFSFWAFIIFKVYEIVETHSGYNVPWSPSKLIPFWGGATFHDYHHRNSVGNYASTFTLWDKLFGTYKNK
ncbi:hypothetical protein DICPUDRAFT_76017 [Dictyostelium purpureum]|uniref:Fatty acid hydroxylase domain-containing protein n=1 Tax=Dictyostelium purpureum TaxID=5786 RepID=F0ZCC5_DICPU|nr:uncharacterized protein DICPUDRAFT_76017 [Dictyostelium purpureum]EGC38421.1 hypothetical protein DICPUDRAFT_76017 [Dictyostelium purpureum]|eukprot:XP_003285082.1 hypothetical protein DICPUDRAFT_76017 [Dictyostelium purpureum]